MNWQKKTSVNPFQRFFHFKDFLIFEEILVFKDTDNKCHVLSKDKYGWNSITKHAMLQDIKSTLFNLNYEK